jgi:hypothetical protein
MLTRLYVDNYKCLVNFDLRLGREHLLMGGNGSGKSTVLEVLSALRRMLYRGGMVGEFLPASTLTRWQRRTRQTFEVEATLDAQSQYRYRLEAEHDLKEGGSIVAREELHLNGSLLYELTPQGAVQLYQEDESGVLFLRSPSQPVLPLLSGTYQRITRFHRWFDRLFAEAGLRWIVTLQASGSAGWQPLWAALRLNWYYQHTSSDEPVPVRAPPRSWSIRFVKTGPVGWTSLWAR